MSSPRHRSGINLARYKTLAFGISAFYAGVAGSLLAIATTFVNPDTFPVTLSIFLLVGVVVGGLGSLGPLVFGAIFIHFMQSVGAGLEGAGSPAVVYGGDPRSLDHAGCSRGGAAGADPLSALQLAATIAAAEPCARPRRLHLADAST